MRLLLLGAALTVALAQTHGVSVSAAGSTVGWQEHSKNDLRSWPQLKRKGGRNFKIDLNFQPTSFCKTQQRVKNKADPRGCFILNHDDPKPALHDTRPDFNTTADVLDFLLANAERWFTKPGPQHRQYIALCGKVPSTLSDPCATTGEAKAWASLMDDFVSEATSLVTQHHLNVEFILDGSFGGDQLCGCHSKRWLPLKATFGSQPSSACAAAYTSNASAMGRMGVLNEPVGTAWIGVTKTSPPFGRFASNDITGGGAYNLQVYEPKDQKDHNSSVSAYVSTGVVHDAGMRFAINFDSAMAQTWSGEHSGYAWNTPAVEPGTQPKVAVVPTMEDEFFGGNTSAVVIAYVRKSDGAFVWQASQLTGSHSELIPSPNNPKFSRAQEMETVRDLKDLQSLSSAELNGSVTDLILASDSEGAAIVLKVVANPPAIDATIMVEQLLAQKGDVFSSLALAACPGTNVVDCLVQLAVQCTTATSCSVVLRLFANATAFTPTLVGIPLTLNHTVAKAAAANISGSVAAVDVPPSAASAGDDTVGPAPPPCAVSDANAVAAIVSYSIGYTVYAAVVCYRSMGPGVVSAHVDGPAQIAVGRAPSVSMATVPGRGIVAMEVHQDGFCQNNEPQNKAPTPAMCEQTPTWTPGVLVYSYGLLGDWANLVASKQMMNACHETLMHGAYDQGSAPDVHLFAAPHYQSPSTWTPGTPMVQAPAASWGIAEVHEGFDPSFHGGKDVGNCGLPVARPGKVVVDGWTPADLW